MNELASIMQSVLAEQQKTNHNLGGICDAILENTRLSMELTSTLVDIHNRLERMAGSGLYDSLSDVCDKLEAISGHGAFDSLADVCFVLESLKNEVENLNAEVSLISIKMT